MAVGYTNISATKGDRDWMNSEHEEPKDITAYRRIRDMLFSRRLIPGQKIVYRDLEEKLEMSKTPVLTALVRLEQDGLVISNHNRGYYIRTWQKTELEQIAELRERLQEILIGYAVKRYGHEELAALRVALDNYIEHNGKVYNHTHWALGCVFHRQIARMSGNDFLVTTLDRFDDILFIAIDPIVLTPLIQTLKEEHESIYRYIEARDADMARETLIQHERKGTQIMLDSLMS